MAEVCRALIGKVKNSRMTRQTRTGRTSSGFDIQTGLMSFPELKNYPHLHNVMTSRSAPALVGERQFNMDPTTGPECARAYEHRNILAKQLNVNLNDTVWFDPDTPDPVICLMKDQEATSRVCECTVPVTTKAECWYTTTRTAA